MAYYDKIASHWHKITGYSGGAFKKHVLNERILSKLISIEGKSILELGAGNGYFMPFVFRKFSGQQPSQVFVTDVSTKMLELAKKHFPVEGAEYRQLDVRGEFPFSDESVDIIMAAMVFNELSRAGLRKALMQCSRVLKHDGRCIVTVLHPAFVRSIAKRERLNKSRGMLTMPGSGGIRVPVVVRSKPEYESLLTENGFELDCEEIYANKKVLNDKPGLSKAGKVPIAVIYDCRKRIIEEE
jgi:SAM-dependent methyltransferase